MATVVVADAKSLTKEALAAFKRVGASIGRAVTHPAGGFTFDVEFDVTPYNVTPADQKKMKAKVTKALKSLKPDSFYFSGNTFGAYKDGMVVLSWDKGEGESGFWYVEIVSPEYAKRTMPGVTKHLNIESSTASKGAKIMTRKQLVNRASHILKTQGKSKLAKATVKYLGTEVRAGKSLSELKKLDNKMHLRNIGSAIKGYGDNVLYSAMREAEGLPEDEAEEKAKKAVPIMKKIVALTKKLEKDQEKLGKLVYQVADIFGVYD
jgi:hypothetical protein